MAQRGPRTSRLYFMEALFAREQLLEDLRCQLLGQRLRDPREEKARWLLEALEQFDFSPGGGAGRSPLCTEAGAGAGSEACPS